MNREPGTGKYETLVARCRELEPVSTAVAHPCEETALAGAMEAAELGLIAPILVGPVAKIEETAKQAGIDLAGTRIVDAAHSHDSAAKAVELVRQGQAELLMKGSLHTDELLGAVVARETGLRTGRRLSHVFIMDVPTYHKVLVVTDAAINIAPSLEDKVDICQNAIDLAISLGVERPKVAILAAVETVNSKMPATLDAAALCKMAERGQITGGVLDGPLAFDNAISKEAARIKGIRSEVAGDPDILLVPDLEAGNMLAKQLIFLANAESAGLVLGARVPIILTSRADSVRSRIASARRRRSSPVRGVRPPPGPTPVSGAHRHGETTRWSSTRARRASSSACTGGRRPLAGSWRRAARSRASAARRTSPRRTASARSSPIASSTPTCATGALRSTRSRSGCARYGGARVLGVGHRVVHGGARFSGPTIVTPEVLEELRALVPLAPLHQPHNLAAIEAVAAPAGRAAGGLLRHRLPPRPAGRRRAGSAAARDPARRRAALRLPRPVLRVHRLGAAGGGPGDRRAARDRRAPRQRSESSAP